LCLTGLLGNTGRKYTEIMKQTLLAMLVSMAMLTSCNLDPGQTFYTNVVIPIDMRNVPEAGVINQPVDIYVSASADNGCWSGIRFEIDQQDDKVYEIWAAADFESTGFCPDVIVRADSTLKFTPTTTGDHIIIFWMSPTVSERDTVVISDIEGKK